MVRFPTPGDLSAAAVKVEIEDPLEEEHGPPGKRSKSSAASQQQWCASACAQAEQQYNPLDEPSPLGLRLKKSPSLVELIQMRLHKPHSSAASCITSSGSLDTGKKKDLKSTAVSATAEKMKASNFPGSLLRIGSWERVSRYEGDLVAKCYYAKHKLVWEVLEGGLKSKIEIQWSDITALKATFPENGPATLDLVLARQPLFFRETNPQPRKHTLWQATSDFTGGEASIHRRHFLQCQQGLLNKHFEKLIQCDPRLNSLSQKPDIILESPYFEPRCTVFEEQDEHKCQTFDSLKVDSGSTFQGFHEPESTCAAPSTSPTSGMRDAARVPDLMAQGTRSPSSVIDTSASEENVGSQRQGPEDHSYWVQLRRNHLRPSMSKEDLVSQLENCISEHTNSGNTANDLPTKAVLEELAQRLLGDSPSLSEECLMSRVNSFRCLLQKDFNAVPHSQTGSDHHSRDDRPQSVPAPTSEARPLFDLAAVEGDHNEAFACKQPPSISRKESFGDLLMNLPRIASMPQFMYNIYEDSENQAR